MADNIFSGVEDTLFIPLVARIEISKKFPEYFYDKKALSLENDLCVQSIACKSSEYSFMASTSRAVIMDNAVNEFISKKVKCNVVCIGCGLETMAWRIKERSKGAHFYEIDFPSVIENRERILGVKENETLIPGNANDLYFAAHIDCNLPTIFVVAGVFQYFKEPEVLALIKKLKGEFNDAVLLFDATNSVGLKYAQSYVKKTGNNNAMMYFCIDNPQEFAKKSSTELVSMCGFFGKALKQLKGRLKILTRVAMWVADSKNRTMILTYKL